LTYASQLVPAPLGSETWSLAWGYMRMFDDMLDSSSLNKEQAMELMRAEKRTVEAGFAGRLEVPKTAPVRHRWLAQFFDNERRYYSGAALKVVKDLYESAWQDVARKGVVIPQKEMDELLYKKARSFFKLYFILSGFDLRDQIDDLSYLLGMGLGMLDDVLDIQGDYEAGYVNITKDEMRTLGIDLEPEDRGFLERIIDAGYLTLRAKRIMSLLLRARRLSRVIREAPVRSLVMRLTEIFAAPILEGRLLPGQRYFFRGGRLADWILPSNESMAYKVGHRFIRLFLSYPQIRPGRFWHYAPL